MILADARHIPLKDESVQTVVCSPPYWGLRDYGILPQVWESEEPCVCDRLQHDWGDAIVNNATNHTDKRRWQHTRNGRDEEQPIEKRVAWLRTEVPQGKFCQTCGAWAGVLGLEPTPELYVQHIVEVFREVWRVLRKDGTCWVNLGDTYARDPGKGDRADYPKSGRIPELTRINRLDLKEFQLLRSKPFW
jgi:DNA modification methylase